MNTIFEDVKKLPIWERIQLVEDIWDSIVVESPNSLKLSAPELDELDRRYKEHKADPSTGVSWEQVRTKLF